MFFRSPSQNTNHEYFPHNEPILENTQRVVFNNSFTVHQRPGTQEKLFQNFEHQTINSPHLNIAGRTDQNIMAEESRQRPVSFYGSPRHGQATLTRGHSYVESSQIPIQHQFMILRNERAQMSEKMRRIEEELFHRDSIIKTKEKEILELKHASSQPTIYKANSYDKFPQFKPEKPKMDFQTAESNDLIRSLKEKIEIIQKENGLLSLKYEQLLSQSKSSFDTGRKIQREISSQQSSLIKSQRLNRQLERQVFDLKQKVKELEDENSKNSTQSSVFNYSLNNFQGQQGASRSISNKDFHSSSFELQKLQNEVKQKNEMIRYLQLQCLRESQTKGSEQEHHKINRLSEQQKKEIAHIKKQLQILKFENECSIQKIAKSANQTEQLRRKNRTLEFLVGELKEQNQSVQKKGQVQRETYESKIQQLSRLLAENSQSVCRQSSQMESGIKNYMVLITQMKTKSAMELGMKDKIIKEQEQEKQKLIDKMADYQLEIKNKNVTICALEDEIAQAKFNEQFRKLSHKTIPGQNIQGMESQLKEQMDKVCGLEIANRILQEQCGKIRGKCQKEVESMKQMLRVSEEKHRSSELQIGKVHEQEKQRLVDELNKQKQAISRYAKSEQNLKKELEVLHETIKQKESEIESKEENGNAIEFESAKLVQKVRELSDFIQVLKSSIQTKQKQMAKLEQKVQMSSKLSQMIVSFQCRLKDKDQEIEKMQTLTQKLNQAIAENSKRDKQRESLEMQKQEQSKKQVSQQMSSQIQSLVCDQKQKQARIKQLEEEVQQKTRQCQIHMEHQHQLLTLRTESIVQIQQIKAIRKMLMTKQLAQNQYRSTLEQKLKTILQLELQLETVKQSLKAAAEQLQEYKLQQQLKLSIKPEAPIAQSLSSRSKAKSLKSLGTQEIFSDKGIDGESFIADFIEIDRNALLYICDLLSIVPSEGEVLKNIIEHIEQNPQAKTQAYYQEVLQLFGVETGLCEETHMNLISSIKEYRMTISALIEKMDLLEKRVDSANKENRTLGKQLDFKSKQNYLFEGMIGGLNGDMMRMGVKRMSEKYGRIQGIEAKEIAGDESH